MQLCIPQEHLLPDGGNRQYNYIMRVKICQTCFYKVVDKCRKREYNISMVKTTKRLSLLMTEKTRSCRSEFFRVLLSVRFISVKEIAYVVCNYTCYNRNKKSD